MPPALDLFGAQTGNCFRAAIALEEAGLAYTPSLVDLASGAHRGPAHLALNPRGRVPVLVVRHGADQNGADELVLTQSNAIALWADVQAPGALLPRDSVARAIAVDRWLFVVTDIIILNGAAFRLQRAGLPKDARAPLEAEATGAAGSRPPAAAPPCSAVSPRSADFFSERPHRRRRPISTSRDLKERLLQSSVQITVARATLPIVWEGSSDASRFYNISDMCRRFLNSAC